MCFLFSDHEILRSLKKPGTLSVSGTLWAFAVFLICNWQTIFKILFNQYHFLVDPKIIVHAGQVKRILDIVFLALLSNMITLYTQFIILFLPHFKFALSWINLSLYFGRFCYKVLWDIFRNIILLLVIIVSREIFPYQISFKVWTS